MAGTEKSREQLVSELAAERSRTSELEEIKKQLLESEERWRSMTEGAPDHVITLDCDLKIEFINVSAPGVRIADVIGTSILLHAEEDDRPRIEKLMLGVLRTHETITYESNYQLLDGTVLIYETRVAARLLGDSVIGLTMLARDSTKRKRAEQALRRSEHHLKALQDNIPDTVFTVDRSGAILYINRAGPGFEESQLLGTNSVDLLPVSERDRYRLALSRAFDDGKSDSFVHAFGNGRFALARVVGIRDGEAPAQSAMIVSTDITDRKHADAESKRLNLQMQHAQKLESLGLLAGGIAHDFNNLLVGILGNTQMALEDASLSHSVRQDLENVVKAGRQCAVLTAQMLAYSGKGKFIVEDIRLCDLVEDMKEFLRSTVSKNAGLEIDVPCDISAFRADATQIRQILMNLVINASEAIGSSPGTVTIRASMEHCDRGCRCRKVFPGADEWPAGPRVTLEVSDTGSGISEEHHDKIFDPFFSTKFTGRGLGMAAVHGILRGHNAGIKFQSTEDAGTVFKVHFVPMMETASPRPQEEYSKAWRGSGTVLLVDDEKVVLRVAAKMLEHIGFMVISASNGAEALEAYAEHESEIVCVLLDLTMPEMSGEETFKRLKGVRADLRILMSSGFTESELSNRFAGTSVAGFVPKPYNLETLSNKFRLALA